MDHTHDNVSDSQAQIDNNEAERSDQLSPLEQLAAWCEWKDLCSIFRVAEPYSIDEKRKMNWKDHLSASTRLSYGCFLSNMVFGRAKDIAAPCEIALDKGTIIQEEGFVSESSLSQGQGNQWDKDNDDDEKNWDPSFQESCLSWDNEEEYYTAEPEYDEESNQAQEELRSNTWFLQNNPAKADFINFFDSYMKGTMPQKEVNGIHVSYKDYVFYLVSQSKDNPLQVINGKILGKTSGYIIDLTKAYIAANYQVTRKNGKLYLIESLNRPVDDSSETELEDLVSARQDEDKEMNDKAGITKLYRRLALSREEKIILVAKSYNIAISNPDLLSILGFKKEAAQNRLNGVAAKLLQYQDDLYAPSAMKQILSLIFKDFSQNSAEKDSFAFLQKVAKQYNHRQNVKNERISK